MGRHLRTVCSETDFQEKLQHKEAEIEEEKARMEAYRQKWKVWVAWARTGSGRVRC